ncbi:MAG: XisH family protein [Gemmataceae bacterium]|nr:XisH family protein [Gemmataceae bacterium]
MPASDAIHAAVKNALVKDGWTITHDPFALYYEDVAVSIDLAGERLLAAERGPERVAVEVKTLASRSRVRDFRDALGQYDVYRMILEDVAPERKLYLAVSTRGYNRVFGLRAVQRLTAKRPLPLVVVEVSTEEVVRWIG